MKRFTATEKWADPWFRRLSLEYKALWQFICDQCEADGAWTVDLEYASAHIGAQFQAEQVKVVLEGRILEYRPGKWWVIKFIDFQYGKLNEKCHFHKIVAALLLRHGLIEIFQKHYPQCSYPSLPTHSQPPSESSGSPTPTRQYNTVQDNTVQDCTGESEGGESKPDRYSPARIALHWLNEKACRHYRESDSNLKLITFRLEEVKGDLDGVKMMIDRQCARWKGTDQAEYLTPDTLFGKKNFGKYYDNRELPVTENNGPNGKPNARNFGIAGDQAERSRRVAETVARRQQEARATTANGVAAAQPGP